MRAQPPEGADDLVGDQQHVVPVADLADPLEVAGRRREAAAGVLHRLQEDRGHRLRALEEDLLLDLVGGPAAERLGVVAVHRRPVDVGVRHLVRAGHQRLEGRLERGQAGDGQRALRGAVVGDGPRDDLVLVGVAGELVVLLGELPRGLDGLAAAGGEEDLVEVAGGVVRQPLGEFDGLGVGVGPDREEGQLCRLLVRRPRPARAGRGRPGRRTARTGRRGSCLPSVVVDVGALAADDGRHGGVLVRRHAGEVHPQVVVRGLGEVRRSWLSGSPGVGLLAELEVDEALGGAHAGQRADPLVDHLQEVVVVLADDLDQQVERSRR